MLGKVMKYEFKAIGRILPLFYIALIAASVFLAINLKFIPVDTFFGTLIRTISGSLYGIILAATAIVTLVILISRYKKSMLGDSGYYMLTLPVKMETHILAKTFSATIWGFFSLVVAIITMLIIGLIINIGNIRYLLNQMMDALNSLTANEKIFGAILLLELLILVILSLTKTALTIYAAMSFGQLSKNHPNLIAVVFYMGFNFIESMIATVILNVLDKVLFINHIIDRWLNDLKGLDLFMLMLIILSTLICVVYFVITNLYMKKKLDI